MWQKVGERKGTFRFPWLACCWPQSLLGVCGFFFFFFFNLAVYSRHGRLFTQIYLCHATSICNAVAAIASLSMPLCSPPKSTQTEWKANVWMSHIHMLRMSCKFSLTVRSYPPEFYLTPLPTPPNLSILFASLFSPTHLLVCWPGWPRCLSPIDLNIQLDGRDTSDGKESKLFLKVDSQAASLQVCSLCLPHDFSCQKQLQQKKIVKIFMVKTMQLSKQFLMSLDAQTFHPFCVWPPPKTCWIHSKRKKTAMEAFKVIFKAQYITHSYLKRTAVSEKVISWIFIGQLHVSGDARDVLLSLLDHAVQ